MKVIKSPLGIKIVMVIILISLCVVILCCRQYYSAVYRPYYSQNSQRMDFTIEVGDTGSEIAHRLEESELIRSAWWARIYFRLKQQRQQYIQAGVYNLSTDMSLSEMYEVFQHGTFDVSITIPEGLRVEEIAGLISEKTEIEIEEFVSLAEEKRGLLFPDTYLVPVDITALEMLEIMEDNFNKKVSKDLTSEFSAVGLSFSEAVTIASIVEREVKYDQDRPVVAGILIKRYLNGWLLEADATVQFAKGSRNCLVGLECTWWSKNLTQSDLDYDSPYNTRKNAGLPPTAICSPGLKSFQAVAEPAETPYWFYLSDSTGKTYYSISYEEHLLKVAQYLSY